MVRTSILPILVLSAGLLCESAIGRAATKDVANVPAVSAELDVQGLDRLLAGEWQRRGMRPAQLVDDVGYLRRVYLDLIGQIPPPETVRAFLVDRDPKKRARIVEELLKSPRYAEHFTDYWEHILFGRTPRRAEVDRTAFRQWFVERLARNLGWDTLVFELVSATGVNSLEEGVAPKPVAGQPPPELPAHIEPNRLNGAVNFLLLYDRAPQDLAGVVSREFLGAQIQCAQCHNHPTEKWQREDFRRFAACFTYSRGVAVDSAQVKLPVKRIDLVDSDRPIIGGPQSMELQAIAKAKPAVLDGGDLSGSGNPRRALASWMTAAKNPWFGRELVNRYWAYFIGRGFFEPVDDLRPGNPTTMPALLDRLAADFVRSGHDLKRLIRLLCASRAYQLSAGPAQGGSGSDQAQLWARHPLRPMTPLELLDSVLMATGYGAVIERNARRPGELEKIRAGLRQSFQFTFDIDEESHPPDFNGTIQQALMLMNGSLINSGVRTLPESSLDSLLRAAISDEQRIEALYVHALSRLPKPAETSYFVQFLNAPRELAAPPPPPPKPNPPQAPVVANPQMNPAPNSPPNPAKPGTGRPVLPDPLRAVEPRLLPLKPTPRQQAYEDIFWALLNSSEFLFRH